MMPAAPSLKRRRVPLACSSCRQRKSRCTGETPCSLCKELQIKCLYSEDGSLSNLTGDRRYILRLERRLDDIERTVEHLKSAQGVAPSVASEGLPEGSTRNSPGHSVSELGQVDASENAIDGMGAMYFTDEEECGFFAYIKYMSRAMEKGNSNIISSSPASSPRRMRGGLVSVSRSQAPSLHQRISTKDCSDTTHVNIYALPPEERTWSLIQQYFQKTGQLLPFIHEMSFCETYLSMRQEGFSKISRTWLGLLNIILAISASLSTNDEIPPKERIRESDIYYQRANGLCDRDSRRNASLEMVQYLLILGQYLQGTQKSTQAWTTHSLAISTAYQLGIHSPSANLKYSTLEHEIRKRTWYGCVLLDRTLSMTFGRPCSIPQSFIRLDAPNKDVQMLSSNSDTSISTQLDGNFFTAAIQLYAILYNVLKFCYGQNLDFQNSPSTTDSISHILDGQRQLNKWRTELVPSLELHIWEGLVTPEDVGKLTTGSVIHHRFNIVLSVRYNNLRILLHRPRLESFLQAFWHSSDISNEDRRVMLPLGLASVQNCVESSTAIISMVYSITTSGAQYRRLLGAWNYSLYYTFNAALVLIGCLMTVSKERKDSPLGWDMVDGSRVYIDKAIEALCQLDPGNRVIERCVEYLSKLAVILDAPTLDRTSFDAAVSNSLSESSDNLLSSDIADPISYMDLGELMSSQDLEVLENILCAGGE
ncbi:uncharacterized protein TRUGW13939_02306 [Talaromyces rugulosus]|uniref:Zn(2)-C6 fungal-type domain-containing protein n=1 Tax=Talaromyces rugulosus TaxID=121627 RepID=A0A7H8QMT6_TALRU|nr:uncharacterized protein TRUGW13939_02306 [Talaromyces rugulosus]QKX55214.1 hypothetical protein TRUGW13939_02306 [Talaromyces rugulosus]